MIDRRQILTAGAGLMATGAMAKSQNMGLPEGSDDGQRHNPGTAAAHLRARL